MEVHVNLDVTSRRYLFQIPAQGLPIRAGECASALFVFGQRYACADGRQATNRITARSASAAPARNGALGPKPVQPPMPCHRTPASTLAGRATNPTAIL